jgi:hypothetical protein
MQKTNCEKVWPLPNLKINSPGKKRDASTKELDLCVLFKFYDERVF